MGTVYMDSSKSAIVASLEPLFQRAYKEKLWFYSFYQGMTFSPNELRECHARERFLWGPDNWELRPPPAPIDIIALVADAEQKNADLQKRIDQGF